MKDKETTEKIQKGLLSLFKPEDADAMRFLNSLYDYAQQIDDFYDIGIKKDDIVKSNIYALSKLYSNSFFIDYGHKLIPLIESAFLQWQSANRMEQAGLANEKSYMLRAFYYQIVHYSAMLLYGNEYADNNALAFQEFYGESFKDYIGEFENA